MSTIGEQFLTVRQVMDRMGARSHDTVIDKIRTPDRPDAPLIGEQVSSMWLITRASVENFLRRERRRKKKQIARGRGYPRGRPRAAEKTSE